MEIGVGNKVVSNFLKGLGLKVITCDLNPELKPDIVADIRNLPFDDNSFDAVVAFEVLEHLPFEYFEKSLKEINRVTKKSAIISLPYACVSLEGLLKVRFNLGKKKIRKSFYCPLKVARFLKEIKIEENKEHYWEMGAKGYSKKKIRNIIKKHFKIIEEFSAELNPYHYFFILEANK